MEEFKKNINLNKLIIGSTKMAKDKLSLDLDNDNIEIIVENEWKNTINLYSNYTHDIKTLNNYCLTLIKNSLSLKNNNNELKDNKNELKQNLKNNKNQLNNIDIDYKKLDTDFLELKVKELEHKRNFIPDYQNNNIVNLDSSNQSKIPINNLNDNNITTINYNNTNNNIIYKSLLLKSNNNFIQVNIKKQFNFDYKLYKFYPHDLYLPLFINQITPYIKLKISDNTTFIIYNFKCIFNNIKWNTWKCIDNFNIDIDLNNSKIELFDYNDQLLNFSNNFINISKFLKINKNNNIFYKLWCDFDYIYNFNNNYEINDKIMIKTNKGFYYTKIITHVDNSDTDYNIIIIYDNDNNFVIDDFNNSTIFLLKNEFSLSLKYYIK